MSKYDILTAMTLFIVGTFIFGMSYHNVDLAYNNRYGTLDMNGFGYIQNRDTMYMNGMSGITISWIFIFVSFIIILMTLSDIYEQSI
jgi:hypothetical protein